MACFFTDLGTPDEFDQDAFDSLFEKRMQNSPRAEKRYFMTTKAGIMNNQFMY